MVATGKSENLQQSPADPPNVAEVIGDLESLQDTVKVLIGMLDHEIGRRYMTFELKLQIERVELLLRTGSYD